ncbi:hypothetical protein NL676_019407 [Syzygium grande]|nr:hypothetical protein NL676_019407 [Syzygium grande]
MQFTLKIRRVARISVTPLVLRHGGQVSAWPSSRGAGCRFDMTVGLTAGWVGQLGRASCKEGAELPASSSLPPSDGES